MKFALTESGSFSLRRERAGLCAFLLFCRLTGVGFGEAEEFDVWACRMLVELAKLCGDVGHLKCSTRRNSAT